MKNRQEMLDYCNEVGKYIESSFYDMNNMLDCIKYIQDCDDNYCDKFMYSRTKLIDYYDEDFYITYHYEAVNYKFWENEEFWKLLKDSNFEVEDLMRSDFLQLNDLKEILFNFKTFEISNYLGKSLIDIIEDNFYHIQQKEEKTEEIEDFIKNVEKIELNNKLLKKLPVKNEVKENKVKI